ncbi:MAG: preprotein translocase subunit SecG [Acholeplasmataceae bacterium]|nr:MAG: preprotein translocase subunit SecG [Acholeplasmataceae bacterium]
MIWVDYIAVVAGIVLITAVLMQTSQDNIQDAFSGEKSELFKNRKARGFDLFLMRSTVVASVVLIAAVILSNNLPR